MQMKPRHVWMVFDPAKARAACLEGRGYSVK